MFSTDKKLRKNDKLQSARIDENFMTQPTSPKNNDILKNKSFLLNEDESTTHIPNINSTLISPKIGYHMNTVSKNFKV